MRDYSAKDVKNVVVLGHSGAGKSTLIESCLFTNKQIDKFGRNNDGTSALNFDPEEGKRGLSVYCHLAPVEWKNKKINFIDTPGYMDYEGEESAGLSVGDTALIVVNGKEGIEPGTERAWKEAVNKRKLPAVFLINRIDDEHAHFDQIYGDLRAKFGKSVFAFELPVVEGGKVTGYADVLEKKAYYFNKPAAAADLPADLEDQIEESNAELMEAIASVDEELMEKFFMEEPFTPEEIAKGLSLGLGGGDIRPVLISSAVSHAGVQKLMDFITDCCPSYVDKGTVKALNSKDEEIELKTDESEAFSAFVFKTIVDPFLGKVSYLKVMSGVLSADSQVYNSKKDANEKISQVFVISGKAQNSVSKLATGDIGAVVKLQNTETNDTLCTKAKAVHFANIDYPEPMLGYAIHPKTKADEDKLSVGIRNLMQEDGTIRLVNNAETHQQVLYGLGDQHIDLIISKLKAKYKVEVETETPIVQYRETIRGKAEAQGRFKKQNGGAGQYGDVWVRFEPCDSEDMVFAEEVFGGAVPKQYFPPTEQGLRDCMNKGVLAGYKVVGVKATLFDGSYHPVDSKEVAFKEAARLAYNKAMPNAKPALLEPIGKVTVVAPEEYTGTLMGDITKRRGLIMDMAVNDEGDQVINAEVPVAEMLTYATELRAMTQGRGRYVMAFDRYQTAPKEVADKVIAEAKARAAE